MIQNYFKIALRNLWKNRLFSLINIFGMSVGMACVVILILFAQKCLTFDEFHAHSDRIYYIQTEINDQKHEKTVYPILEQLQKNYPEIEAGTHIQTWYSPWIHYGTKDLQESTVFVDSTFFQIFSFPLKYGTPTTALKGHNSIVISEKIAQNLFGNINPLGKTVTLDDTLQFKVSGVLEPIPSNSSQQFEVVLPTHLLFSLPDFKKRANWFNIFSPVFVLLKKGTDPKALEAKLPHIVKNHFVPESRDNSLHLSKFKHFIHNQNPTFKGLIYGAIAIAVFLLLIISINLINLNMASALPRLKEVAVKQVIGATRSVILKQFWLEAGIVMLLSLWFSGFFAKYYLIPSFNQLREGHMQLDISLEHDYPTIVIILSISLLVTFVAGTYPAYYLMQLKTTEAVKGKISSNPQRGRFRQNSLIVLQFVLAVMLIVGTLGLRQQINFMKTTALGYDKNNVLVFNTNLDYRNSFAALSAGRVVLDELRQNPNVESFCTSTLTPVKYWYNFNEYYPAKNPNQSVRILHASTFENYFETYQIPFIEGRSFLDNSADSANHNIIINEAAMRAFGWKTAVGKQLRQQNDPTNYTVIGVTKNFHYQNLKESIEPLLHWYAGKQKLSNFLTIRLKDPAKASTLIKTVEARFKNIPSRRPLSHFYLSDELAKTYRPIDSIWQMISFVTLLAILIACAGIFGLISLVAKQRTKEIGIRKALGASVTNIVAMLSGQFLQLVGIALGISLPISYWLGQKLLETFAYRTQLQWWYLIFVAIFALIIALVSVSFQALRAALNNPVESLKTD